jgi:hypothetical protein
MRKLYQEAGLNSRQIAAILGMPERTVRARLRRYGVETRTRGGWNREDRAIVPAGVVRLLYGTRTCPPLPRGSATGSGRSSTSPTRTARPRRGAGGGRGQREDETPDWPAGRRYAAHHALIAGDRAYLRYDDAAKLVSAG